MQPPSTANKACWPPNYTEVYGWRQQQVLKLKDKPELILGALEYYRARPVEFINHWVSTYDPRNSGGDTPARLPMVMFPKQAELVEFVYACLDDEAGGLIEKARDMGATWVSVGISVHLWLFWPGAAIGWGSRKEQLVDKIGDPDSIFEKIRLVIRGLPRFFWPAGFDPEKHASYMKIINPANGATITGEAGDNIGRGGRKLIYFKDESAHYDRPEKIEAALADNTRVQIDISSVNGVGNVFHRRRESGQEWRPGAEMESGRTRVFVMDWSDHPAKTQDWYEARKKRALEEGLGHVFAQEVERNYEASVDGVIIDPEWVRAAVDAHKKLGLEVTGGWCAALDVADGGIDKNAFGARQGIVIRRLDEWGARDTGITTRKAVGLAEGLGDVELQYDCIGVGAGVKAEANRLGEEGLLPKGVRFVPWNAGAAALNPDGYLIPGDRDSPTNKEYFANLKAQGWWQLSRRFYRTWQAVTEGVEHDPDSLISLDSEMPLLRSVMRELSQPTAGKSGAMKMLVNKTPEGTKSPNLGDVVMMMCWPIESQSGFWML